MTKDLEKEYLEDLDHYDEGMGIHSTSYKRCKERLIRLAKIDSASPSEALEKIKQEFGCDPAYYGLALEFETIEQALTELQAIKEAKPSEVLKCVDILKEEGCIETLVQGKALETIRQALLKAEKLEKAWEVVVEKDVIVEKLKQCNSYDEYNKFIIEFWGFSLSKGKLLTQEEFELIKEMLE